MKIGTKVTATRKNGEPVKGTFAKRERRSNGEWVAVKHKGADGANALHWTRASQVKPA